MSWNIRYRYSWLKMCSTYFDILVRFETIELIQKLEHSSLNFGVTSAASRFHSRRSNRVDLVHENNTWRVLSRHHEKFSEEKNLPIHLLRSHDSTWPCENLHRWISGQVQIQKLGWKYSQCDEPQLAPKAFYQFQEDRKEEHPRICAFWWFIKIIPLAERYRALQTARDA